MEGFIGDMIPVAGGLVDSLQNVLLARNCSIDASVPNIRTVTLVNGVAEVDCVIGTNQTASTGPIGWVHTSDLVKTANLFSAVSPFPASDNIALSFIVWKIAQGS